MNEQISALADEELELDDVSNVITMMQSNKQATASWSEYHLIGDAMRSSANFRASKLDLDAGLSSNFKQNLMQKLELEPTVLSPNAILANVHLSHQAHRKVPVVWSIAASFVAVLVVGWMVLHQQIQGSQDSLPIEVAQAGATDQALAAEYLVAHQVSAPSASSYYIQSVSYSE